MKKLIGSIPNFLGERNYTEVERQCIALFVAVALEKDPAKRLALRTRRDELRLALLLRDSAAAKHGTAPHARLEGGKSLV